MKQTISLEDKTFQRRKNQKKTKKPLKLQKNSSLPLLVDFGSLWLKILSASAQTLLYKETLTTKLIYRCRKNEVQGKILFSHKTQKGKRKRKRYIWIAILADLGSKSVVGAVFWPSNLSPKINIPGTEFEEAKLLICYPPHCLQLPSSVPE